MKVKGELEDLAFKHLHPEVFQVMTILRTLSYTSQARMEFFIF